MHRKLLCSCLFFHLPLRILSLMLFCGKERKRQVALLALLLLLVVVTAWMDHQERNCGGAPDGIESRLMDVGRGLPLFHWFGFDVVLLKKILHGRRLSLPLRLLFYSLIMYGRSRSSGNDREYANYPTTYSGMQKCWNSFSNFSLKIVPFKRDSQLSDSHLTEFELLL